MQRRRRFHFVLLLFSLAMFCAATAIATSAQTFTTLVSFGGTNGAGPQSSLVQGTDGNFYGTTTYGGANCNPYGCGTIFKMTPSGTLTTLYSFCAQTNCSDGESPKGLVQGTDGNFYGTTLNTVFKITPGGTLTTLHIFNDYEYPQERLVQATDGNFYGTTFGMNDCGTVFKITTGGTLTTLHSFDAFDGCTPLAGLAQATDGNFYGTTSSGGAGYRCGGGCGTVFKITLGGALTTLHIFDDTDGASPRAGLVEATDGNFYGTTWSGGAYDFGTVFEITPSGTLTTLHSFDDTDGAQPQAGLIQATDGNFYGTTAIGGNDDCTVGCGTVFAITPGGAITTLHSFDGTDGLAPEAGLLQGTDGNFYGTTYQGGVNNNCKNLTGCRTVFSLSVGLGPFVETQPTSGKVGDPVIILGTNLTGATGVTFNGTPAMVNVVSPTEITTNVPAGATTGLVQVTGTPSGTLTSNTYFWVITPLQFVPVTPCRLVDTRNTGGAIPGGTSRDFAVPQLGGCNIPATAGAYSLNVTAVPQGALGYLTIWPANQGQPLASTLNSLDGRVKANAAIALAGVNAAVSVFVSNTSDAVLDIDGYFAQTSGSTLAFYPLTPCRVADTRNPNSDLGGPFLTGKQERDSPVLESSCIPSGVNAQAYSFNFTAVPLQLGQELGYLTVWPTGESQPVVSTLNNLTGTIVANAAIVPAGTNGGISVYPDTNTNLVIDINGYFAAPGQGGLSLYPAAPCRALDTRSIGNLMPFSGLLSPPVDVVDGPCAPPSTAQAYVFNATVVPTGALGYLSLWPDGEGLPLVSTLNAIDGAITSNMAIVPNINGNTDAYASGITQLILDISSYFAP